MRTTRLLDASGAYVGGGCIINVVFLILEHAVLLQRSTVQLVACKAA